MFRCGARFLAEEYQDTADPESFATLVRQLMNPAQGRAYVLVQGSEIIGGAGVLFFPCWYDANRLDAQELFWWIEPEHRGKRDGIRLIERIEADAKAAGVHRLMLIHPAGNEKVGFFYARRGYTKTETVYSRRL